MQAPRGNYRIREASPEMYERLGQLVAESYEGLTGMPRAHEQPEYYAMLRDVAARTKRPFTTVFAAVDEGGAVIGCVDYIADTRDYGGGGTAAFERDAAGIRLLAVDPAWRGRGVGKSLTQVCIARARESGRASVILHTTRAMEAAWGMYERMGFERLESLDFMQGRLEVFGFRLALDNVERKGGRHVDSHRASGNGTRS